MDDIFTQRLAYTIAHDYGIAPIEPMKTERAITPQTDVNSLWLATKDRNIRCFVQFHTDQVEH